MVLRGLTPPGSPGTVAPSDQSTHLAAAPRQAALTPLPPLGINRAGDQPSQGGVAVWRKILSTGWAITLGGCVSGPLLENPVPVPGDPVVVAPGAPVFLPQSAAGFDRVFEKCLDVVQDYFDIDMLNTRRHAGTITTLPRIAPGIERPFTFGSPDLYQRLLAFTQTIRHRCIIQITPGRDGGYFIDVKVLKELEDKPTPNRALAGEATFRLDSTVERQFEVVEAVQFDNAWIPVGRDACLEQAILERISRLDSQPLFKVQR